MRALVLIFVAACAGVAPRVVSPGHDGDFAPTIPDPATWSALAARAGSEVLARVEVVKVIYDGDDHHLYFTQSRRWPIHYDFAHEFLSRAGAPVVDHWLFNQHEYHDADRRFVLGAITHYVDQDAWTFELFAGDRVDLDTTARVFAAIKGALWVGDKLRYRPIPAAHQAAIERVRALMPVMTTEELFAGLRYQPIEPGAAWGYLRIIPAGAPLPNDLHPYDVVVIGTLPTELPPVAAVITDELQAPLGHIAVLAHGRATPDMALRGATTLPAITALAGLPVHVVVGADYTIEAATQADLDRVARARAHKGLTVRRSFDDVGLPVLAKIDGDDIVHFGAKTAQLAKVAALPGIRTPRAFGLSFAGYAQFLAANGLDRRIAALLADPTFRADPVKRRAALDDLRAAIDAAAVPPKLCAAIAARIRAVLPGARQVRLRSSTNAEDLDGFSGAGLYRSAIIDPTNMVDLQRGLREVWGSVWSWDAFEERAWYGIDQSKIAMAILVQESIDDDVVNGVAITGNPYFEGRPAVYINAQARGGSVTGAAGDEVPEQSLYYVYDTGRSLERISDSSRARGQRLMTDAELGAFAKSLEAIHTEFTGKDVGDGDQAVDVEFLLGGNRQLIIVQARPYRMRWAADRARE